MKHCSTCKIEKQYKNFYKDKRKPDGVMSRCKECTKNYHQQNPNPEYRKKYREKNKSKLTKQIMEWQKNHYHTNLDYRLQKCIRSRIREYIKYDYDATSSLEYIGCSFEFYKQHLENQFTKEMNWDNYGSYWEIDHIKPLSKGGSFHYTNTQPLTVKENRRKGAKYLDT